MIVKEGRILVSLVLLVKYCRGNAAPYREKLQTKSVLFKKSYYYNQDIAAKGYYKRAVSRGV